jgi:hypothetical protein
MTHVLFSGMVHRRAMLGGIGVLKFGGRSMDGRGVWILGVDPFAW